MSAEEGDQAVTPVAHPRPLLASLDERPPTRGGAVLLLLTSALFALCFLATGLFESYARWVTVVSAGPSHFPVGPAHLETRRLIGYAIFSLVPGALSGAAVRRLKWLVAAGVIALPLAANSLAWIALTRHGFPVQAGSAETIRLQLRFGAAAGAYLACVLVLGGLGGLASPWIFRRVRLSLTAVSALGWVGSAWLHQWSFWAIIKLFPNGYGGGLILGAFLPIEVARDALPYLLPAACMVWATRGRGLWIATLVVGASAVFGVAFGGVHIITGNSFKDSLELVRWALNGIASAAAGAWLAVALLRSQSWARLARDAVIVAGIIAVAGWVGWFTEKQPSGFRYHPTSRQVREGGRTGISTAVQPPVKDREIVLLIKGDTIGAVIPTKQTTTPERISYDWYYRTDGGGTFRPADEMKYRSGHTRNAKSISFGPFSVWWSGHDEGSGYLYYEDFPGYPISKNDIRMCVTHEWDLRRIDAFDRRWVFKGSPSDPGMRLTRRAP